MGLLSKAEMLDFRHVTAIILGANGMASLQHISYYLTPDIWLYRTADGRNYLVKIPYEVVNTITMKGTLAARFVLYDIRHATSIDGLDGLRDIIAGIYNTSNPPITIRDILPFNKSTNHTLEYYLSKIDVKSVLYSQPIHDWINTYARNYIVQPLNILNNVFDSTVKFPQPILLADIIQCGSEYTKDVPALYGGKIKRATNSTIILIIVIMAVIIAAAYVMYGVESGQISFDLGLPGLGSSDSTTVSAGGPCSASSLQSEYDSTLDMAVAIQLGELPCTIDTLEPPFNAMVGAEDPALVQWAADQALLNEASAVQQLAPNMTIIP
ncbi:MAG: hypothetical protein F4Y18_02785 [Cenarchaeum sp. SB0663_bin_5]|nr:hypothetical protein [Cenarchaeum sp. SB0663_bin_5]MYL11508.1 hypothetical protein [Cenarchaeum sp. SB0669_bin_11]